LTTCRYCGAEFRHSNLSRHEIICPRNPDVFERMRAFMWEWAEDGVGLPATMYAEFVHGLNLPWLSSIQRAFGGYGEFVRACGLEHRPYQKAGPRPEDMPGSVMAEDYTVYDPSVLRCVPVRIPVRAWEPRQKRYVDVAIQEAWQVR
jgi:hypothetical protein